VSADLPSAFYRALGKADFTESRTRQSPTLGKDLIYRVQDTRHSQALGKDCFAESQTLGKDGSRQRAVSGRLQLTAVSLCRVVPNIGHSSKDTLPSVFSRHSVKDPSPSLGAVTVTFLCRVSNGTRQILYRVPDKKYSAKRPLPMYNSPSVPSVK
jgi:hypothetical protein